MAHAERLRKGQEQRQQKDDEPAVPLSMEEDFILDPRQSLESSAKTPHEQILPLPDSQSMILQSELNLIEASDLLVTSQNLSDAVVGSVASSSNHVCHECGEAFRDADQLEGHAKKMHVPGDARDQRAPHRVHKCLLCPVPHQEMMTFATKKELRAHEREFHLLDGDSKVGLRSITRIAISLLCSC